MGPSAQPPDLRGTQTLGKCASAPCREQSNPCCDDWRVERLFGNVPLRMAWHCFDGIHLLGEQQVAILSIRCYRQQKFVELVRKEAFVTIMLICSTIQNRTGRVFYASKFM